MYTLYEVISQQIGYLLLLLNKEKLYKKYAEGWINLRAIYHYTVYFIYADYFFENSNVHVKKHV